MSPLKAEFPAASHREDVRKMHSARLEESGHPGSQLSTKRGRPQEPRDVPIQ